MCDPGSFKTYLISGNAAAVFDEAFGVDFDDGGFDVTSGGDAGIGIRHGVAGFLEGGAGDDFGAGGDEGDFASGCGD